MEDQLQAVAHESRLFQVSVQQLSSSSALRVAMKAGGAGSEERHTCSYIYHCPPRR